MTRQIGWLFPPTNGGISTGINDPGMAHFTGQPLASLARETIQNSLDACLDQEQPVHVSFELLDCDLDQVGRSELATAIESCRSTITEHQHAMEAAALREAAKFVEAKQVPCLRISDRNTTGLFGENWRALVKMQGFSHKPDMEGAGGSHGIGKYAPFAVSNLRTVFYWTCFIENGQEREKFQGKSVLISHSDADGNETQGTGFFGLKEGCLELTDGIPNEFRVIEKDQRPARGTSVTVMGFQETGDWRSRIAESVIENFFYAIGTERLNVIVEPDKYTDLMEMDRTSIDKWFEYLQGSDSSENPQASTGNSVKDAQIFWELSKEEPAAEKQDVDLGHCRLWISTAEGLPRKVAFVRRTGMLVTTQQAGLIRFHGFRDFAALCVFEDPEGNELLRRMENPRHDQFEPNRLPRDDRDRGRRALKRITDWVRGEIRKQAGPPEGGEKTVLSELAVYLPDYQPEEPFEESGDYRGEGHSEPGFGAKVKISLKPVRKQGTPKLPKDSDADSEGDGNDTGAEGGAGTGEGGSGGGG
ncbi:MAG: hypothetical protein F4X57_11215, partial [Chloroflexi bacterium]|nr:hypothetical protein [Chloroflexota bacterium]